MANPAGYMNTYSPQPPQPGDGIHPGSIPNGQPPQFNRPPVFPQKVAPPRPAMIGQQQSFSAHQAPSNGQHSHPSSLSSHSSRNPSPVPLRPGGDSLSTSTPNLANRPPSQNRVFEAPPPQMPPAPPTLTNHQRAPPSAGAPYPGQTSAAAGHQRQTYVPQQQNSTTQNVPNLSQASTVAASQPSLGPIRHQMHPPQSTQAQIQPQLLPSLSNSPLNSVRPATSSQSGVIRPQMLPNMPSNLASSQFGIDRQFAANVAQMPLNSPQPAPSYQSGSIRPQMPPNMSQIPLNPLVAGQTRQIISNPQTSLNSQQMPPAQFNSIQTPNQMLPPPSKMVPPNQQGYTNPNIPPKSVLNLNNGARYPEPGFVGPSSQPATVIPGSGPPRPSMAQNRYPASTQPQFNAVPSPQAVQPPQQNAYPGMAPPRTNALGTLPLPGQAPPHLPPPPGPQSSQSLPGTPQNRPSEHQPQSRMAPYQSLPPGTGPQPGGPPPLPTGVGYAQPPVFAPPQSPSRNNDGQGGHLGKRYPTQSQPYTNQIQPNVDTTSVMNQQMASMSVAQHGFQKLWGGNSYDLLQHRNILPPEKVETPKVKLHQEFLDSVNCSPEIFRCTMTKIPETSALLQKSRLPLGILIHPFKDLNECRLDDQGQHSSNDDECTSDYKPSLKHLAVIQCSSIVRCRACRTYINPFVYFVDHKRWKCNLCFRVNELPEEFQFDPVSKTYGDPTRRPEIKSATIEFIAPSEYMLRPPQPAVYLFLLDVSRLAVECGYLRLFCATLIDELDKLPGDGRTQVGFIAYDSAVHFYSLAEGLSQPQQMTVVDVDDIFLPVPDSLIANLNESKELIRDLLTQLPIKFQDSNDTHSALGPALQAAYKLMAPTGGRVTVFQSCLPNFGPGALVAREDPTLRAGKEAPHLNPATDFYKRLALDCSGQQIAVDLFIVNSQYCDLATLSGISRFSGGCIHHIPLFKANNPQHADKLQQSLRRYLSRKLGMEAVMRIRCSRGLSIHTFHGNFFVRSTDLLSLPNVNPDAGFGMQVSVEENLSDLQNVCFQAALLYTSTKGERRIRVHTMCLPVCANLGDVIHSADQQCIVGLLAKMGVDRSHQSSLSDARDAFINVAIDVLSAYRVSQATTGTGALLVPHNLRLLPLYILALLKYVAFRTGQSTRLDDRLFAMCQMKTLPLANLMQEIYPDLYPIHNLGDQGEIDVEGIIVPQPPRLQLTSEKLETSGAYLLDAGDHMIVFVGRNVNATFCQAVLGVQSFAHVSEDILDLPEVDTPESERLRRFVNHLQTEKSYPATIQLIRDDSQTRVKFYERLIEDRTESALSYYEFLQHLKTNVK